MLLSLCCRWNQFNLPTTYNYILLTTTLHCDCGVSCMVGLEEGQQTWWSVEL